MNIYIIIGLTVIVIIMFQQQFINKEKENKIECYFDQIKVPLFITCVILIIYYLYFYKDTEIMINTQIPPELFC